jgi:hypothetical protein
MAHIHIGTLNVFDFANLPDGRSNLILTANDPILVKREIGLLDVNDNLFTAINSGVRFWPFLLVSRDLDATNSTQRILSELRRIQNIQQRNYQTSLTIGPLSMSTFNFYRRMYRRLKERHDPDFTALRNFIEDRRRKYKGDFGIYRRNGNTKKWKRALVKSMGIPGRQFAKLLNELRDKDETEDIVEEAITRILKHQNKYNEWLWKGALCYAFLRCMYGINKIEVDEERVTRHIKASDWAEILVQVLSSPKTATPDRLKRYIPLIRRSKDSPPWKRTTKTLKDQNRIVLSNLRFNAFYNLYFRPIPTGY